MHLSHKSFITVWFKFKINFQSNSLKLYLGIVVVVEYNFRHFNYYIFTEFNRKNIEEERSSGTTGTGVSQKDLQISEKTKEEEKC